MSKPRKAGLPIPVCGMKINHYTLIEPARLSNGKRGWLCECDCEDKTRKVVDEYALISGSTKSCGCRRLTLARNQNRFRGLSFKEWCGLNGRQDLLERWDTKTNTFSPSEIGVGTKRKFWFKCSKNPEHSSELHGIQGLSDGSNQIACRQCNSFGQWCVDNNRPEILARWDYEKNNLSPFEVSYSSGIKRWFKCPCGKHPSELKMVYSYVDGHLKSLDCKMCSSFAEKNIQKFGAGFLGLYWSSKNSVDPWKITYASSDQKIYLRCQEDGTHDDYLTTPAKFNGGRRCPVCGLNISKSKLQKDVEKYLVVKGYTPNTEFDCAIITYSPINNRPMPYDFEIPELKLIIEVQGEQHYKPLRKESPWLRGQTPEAFLETREYYDTIKRQYATQCGYHYLEIFHNEHQNDQYKEKIDQKLQQILSNR